MNFSKTTFNDSSLPSFSVLPSESLRTNILFGTTGVILSEICFFIDDKLF